MQNKEIEEKIKRVLETKQRGICAISVESLEVILQYIDQLENKVKKSETDKQKLIEKLEKDKVKYNEFEFMPLQIEKAYNNYYKLGKIDLADEILKILKGENNG